MKYTEQIDLLYSMVKEEIKKEKKVYSATEIKEYLFKDFFAAKNEKFIIVYLDNANKIKGKRIFKGTINQCSIYVRTILKDVFKYNAISVIISHNHPGNSKEFSQADIKITKKLFIAFKILEINMMDHILFTDTGTVSFQNKLGFYNFPSSTESIWRFHDV